MFTILNLDQRSIKKYGQDRNGFNIFKWLKIFKRRIFHDMWELYESQLLVCIKKVMMDSAGVVASCMVQGCLCAIARSGVVGKETACPTKPEIFRLWHFTEKGS